MTSDAPQQASQANFALKQKHGRQEGDHRRRPPALGTAEGKAVGALGGPVRHRPRLAGGSAGGRRRSTARPGGRRWTRSTPASRQRRAGGTGRPARGGQRGRPRQRAVHGRGRPAAGDVAGRCIEQHRPVRGRAGRARARRSSAGGPGAASRAERRGVPRQDGRPAQVDGVGSPTTST